MGRKLFSTSTISAVLLITGGNLAFAQRQKPIPPSPKAPVFSEWQRVMAALKKAKPMPEPLHSIRPNTAGPAGNLVRFDPKTGAISDVPAAEAKAASGLQHSDGKPGAPPMNVNGGKPQLSTTVPKQGVSQPTASAGGPSPNATPPGPLYYPYTFPWNSIGRLLLRFNDGINDYYYLCSASTASDFHMISAGHCVYNHDIRNDGSGIAGWAQEVWAWVAETDVVDPIDPGSPAFPLWPDFPYGVAKMTYEVTYNNWINSSDLNWDFSFLTLDRNIGDHVGWMGREWGVNASALNFDGYPAESPYVSPLNPYQYPGFDAGNVIGYTCCRIEMSAYTYGGHSGGPDWRYDGTNDWVEGVNSTSNRAGYAEATLLTSQIETDLVNQITSDQSVRPPAALAQVIEYVFNGTSKGLGQTSTEIGFQFPLTLNAFNAGYSDAGDTFADIYLTSNGDDVASGIYIGSYDFGYLGTYTYTVQTPNITVPMTVPPGTYFVGYLLGAANSQYGTDRNDVVIEAQTMTTYCNNDSYEPDNTSSQASNLGTGGVQNHTLCAQSDQDWVSFNVPLNSAATITTEGFTGGDTTMTLYDHNLNQIDFNDDNGVDFYSTINRTCATNPLAPGTYYIQIQSYLNRTSIPYYTLTLSTSTCSVSTSTSVVSSLNPSVFGQSVKFTATVGSGSGTPTGSVTFKDGSATIGSGTLSGGKASFSTSNLAGGSHSITAVYAGSSPWATSTSSPLTQTVNKAASATAEISSMNPAPFGKNITFTARVTAPVGTPTGSVTFKNGSATLGTVGLSGGFAKLNTSTLAVGSHSITAQYAGNGNYKSSGSPALTENITKAGSAAQVLSSNNPSTHGNTVTFKAVVKSATTGVPTGSVTFKNGSAVLGTKTLNSSGQATLGVSSLAVGSHSITVVYAGDVDFNGTTSPVLNQQVNP